MRYKVLLFITGIVLLSCGKADNRWFPYASINLQIPINDPRIQGIKTPGNGIEIGGGVGGIILYRKLSGNRVVAYDKRSPASLDKGCDVRIQEPSIIAIDTCANVTFSLENDGTVIKGNYARPLQQYSVSEGNGLIMIYN